MSCGVDAVSWVAPTVAGHHDGTVRRNSCQTGCSADPNVANDDALLQINHRNIRRARVGHVAALAIVRDIDEVGLAMNADDRNDRILFRVDDGDVVRLGIYDVDFILLGIRGDPRWFAAYVNGLGQRKGSQIDDGYSVAFAIADVSILAICGTVVGKLALVEIPPAEAAEDGQQHDDEEEFSHA